MPLKGQVVKTVLKWQETGPAVSLCENKLCKRGRVSGSLSWFIPIKNGVVLSLWCGVWRITHRHLITSLLGRPSFSRAGRIRSPKSSEGSPGGPGVDSKSFQSPPALCHRLDCSRQVPLSERILQARILNGLPRPLPGESFWPRDWSRVSYIDTRVHGVAESDTTEWACHNSRAEYRAGFLSFWHHISSVFMIAFEIILRQVIHCQIVLLSSGLILPIIFVEGERSFIITRQINKPSKSYSTTLSLTF